MGWLFPPRLSPRGFRQAQLVCDRAIASSSEASESAPLPCPCGSDVLCPPGARPRSAPVVNARRLIPVHAPTERIRVSRMREIRSSGLMRAEAAGKLAPPLLDPPATAPRRTQLSIL